MARKKKDKAPAGTPEWMVTYGDMMTLLLCFFVMIVAMSEIKKDDQFRKVVESIKREFGYNHGIGTTPHDVPPDVSVKQRKRSTAGEQQDLNKGFTDDEASLGERDLVVRIREGMQYTVGGVVAFADGRAELLPEAYEPLQQTAQQIRGLAHKIVLQGHTSVAPLPPDSPYASHMDLSLARASAVYRWLIGTTDDRGRIDPRRIRVAGAAGYEPIVARAYDRTDWIRNDRVDIIMIEALTREFEGEASEQSQLSRRSDGAVGETYAARE